jgi:acetyl esterase/lipase
MWKRATVLLGILAGCTAPVEIHDVAYDDRFGDATTMDVYLPDEEGTARPAVLFIHGGGWRNGSKAAHAEAAARLARSGYVAASINYRLTPDGVFPRAVQDCLCALSFLRAHADEWGIDPARVAVAGYSAGGHLAGLVGVAADDPRLAPDCAAGPTFPPAAAIPGAGPMDLLDFQHDVVVDFVGVSAEEDPERWELASPLSHVGPDEPPFLFIHGSGDWFVEIDQARRMDEALRAAGNDSRVLELDGGGHLLNPGDQVGDLRVEMSMESPEAWLAIMDFLERKLGGSR